METEDDTHQIGLVLVYYGPNGGDPAAGAGAMRSSQRLSVGVVVAAPAPCASSIIDSNAAAHALVPRYCII